MRRNPGNQGAATGLPIRYHSQIGNPGFYVLPFYASHKKLQCYVPNLIQDTWLLPIAPMVPSQVFGTNKTKVVHCHPGIAVVNPEYQLQRVSDVTLSRGAGISAGLCHTWQRRPISRPCKPLDPSTVDSVFHQKSSPTLFSSITDFPSVCEMSRPYLRSVGSL